MTPAYSHSCAGGGSEAVTKAAREAACRAAALDAWLAEARAVPLALAFSGGLDSRFLAHMAARAAGRLPGPRLALFHITGPHVPAAERVQALDWARARGLELILVPVNPLEDEAVRANGRLRCYHCKRRLFSRLLECAKERFGAEPFRVCDGTNASDLTAYRPGLRALEELGIFSPLALAGFSKELIRIHAAATGMDRPNQPARPCLLTRFAYDLAPDATSLAAVERAEEAVADLLRPAAGGSGAGPDAADPDGPHPREQPAKGYAPDFRLRLTASEPGSRERIVELHLGGPVPPEMERALRAAVRAAGLPEPSVRVPESLSGHFDRAVQP